MTVNREREINSALNGLSDICTGKANKCVIRKYISCRRSTFVPIFVSICQNVIFGFSDKKPFQKVIKLEGFQVDARVKLGAR